MQNEIEAQDDETELFFPKMMTFFTGSNLKMPTGFILSLTIIAASMLLCMECAPYGDAAATLKYASCTQDVECGQGKFCYTTNLDPVCKECIDCDSYNRVSRYPCAKSKQECGECLPGYREIKATRQCVAKIPSEDEISGKGSTGGSAGEVPGWAVGTIIMVTGAAVVVIGSAVFIHRKRPHICKKDAGKENLQMELLPPTPSAPLPPPPYTPHSTEMQLLSEVTRQPPSNPHYSPPPQQQTFTTKCSEDTHQRANPFNRGTSAGEETDLFLQAHAVPEEGDMVAANEQDEIEELFNNALEHQPADPDAEVPDREEELSERSMELQVGDEDMDIPEEIQPLSPPPNEEYFIDVRLDFSVRLYGNAPSGTAQLSPPSGIQVVPNMDVNNNDDQTSHVEVEEIGPVNQPELLALRFDPAQPDEYHMEVHDPEVSMDLV